MKASTNQIALKNGLSTVTRFVSPRSTLPVLANVLLEWKMDGRMKLAATNLEQGCVTWTQAAVESEGSITVPARLLADLVSTLPNDTVSLSVNPNTQTLTVKCGASSTEIKGIAAEEFPPMPEVQTDGAQKVRVGTLKEAIAQTAFAASADEARPTLQGVQTALDGLEMVMVATDGFRVSVRRLQFDQPVKKGAGIIPARALTELARIATDPEEMVSVVFAAGQVSFVTESVQLTSQLIDGNFPDYKVIVPKSFKCRTTVNRAEFLGDVRRAEIIARSGNDVVRLNIQPNMDGNGQIDLSATSEETGENEGQVYATIDGAGHAVAFNVRFLREALEVIKTPQVLMETNDHKSPALFRPVGDDSLMIVTMPMHLGK